MRIIGGKLSGRVINAPEGRTTRPMLDRVRESLFNILDHHDWGKKIGKPLDKTSVMDAFCGTGALAFEALSRGAARATLFDQDGNALKVAKDNAGTLGLQGVAQIISADTLKPPRAAYECRMVFVAPPYRKGLIAPGLAALDEAGWVADNALILCETARKEALELPDGFTVLLARFYGDTGLHFVSRVA